MRVPKAAIVLLLFSVARAQSIQSIYPETQGVWPIQRTGVGEKLKIVTLAAPHRMQSCTLRTIDDSQISCARRLGFGPVSYQRDDVAAILTAGKDSVNKKAFRICGAVTGGVMAGAVVWGLRGGVGNVVGSVLVGLLAFSVFGACGIGDNEDDAIAPAVIYLRPGETLQAKLH